MCGIVGYIGNKAALDPILDGLEALEYRGYDSAGMTVLVNGKSETMKCQGQVAGLKKLLSTSSRTSHVGIGHTRWATHGIPSQKNAHPHANTNKTIHVVHNGIIENYQEIREKLQKFGYIFVSDTDSEVIPQLIDFYLKDSKNFLDAFKKAVLELNGAYAIAALYSKDPGTVYVAKLSSPLVIGVGENEHIIASDISAITEHTTKVLFLDDYEVGVITKTSIKISDIKKSVDIKRHAEDINFDSQQALLGDFPHFMLKEIFEAPQTIQAATRGRLKVETSTVRLGGLNAVMSQLDYIDRIVIVACGTSYYAGLVGEYMIEELAGIPVEVQLASEFKYRHEPLSRSTVLLAISQSGETADTIAALKKVENYGILRLGIVNAVGSTIARMTEAGVYCHAGPELSVASTKAFISQVTILSEIALYLSKGNNALYKPLINEIVSLPDKTKELLRDSKKIEKIAKKYSHNRDFLFIGRNYLYPCALEGALKLKEVSYIHAEGYAAGEMKHGPLAMIDKNFPTFVLAPNGQLLDKVVSNIEEIKARNGPIIAIASKNSKKVINLADDVIFIPDTLEQLQPLLVSVVTQLFAYYVAVAKDLNVDRPRNLAKSVTVE